MYGDLHQSLESIAMGFWPFPAGDVHTRADTGLLADGEEFGTEARTLPLPTAQCAGGLPARLWEFEREQFSQTLTEYCWQVMAGLHPLPTAEQEAVMMERAAYFGEWEVIKVTYLLSITKWVLGQ